MAQFTATLRALLSPHYAVYSLPTSTLLAEPWPASTALLAMPGGADLPYCSALNGAGNTKISNYIHKGGKYLGCCAGGYYASSRVEFEQNDPRYAVIGPRELAFYPGVARGTSYPGFVYDSENGAKAAAVQTETVGQFCCYYNGGGVFADADSHKDRGVEVLARYVEPVKVEGGDAAVVYCPVGKGAAVLSGIHPEFSPTRLKPKDQDTHRYKSIVSDLKKDNPVRLEFMKSILLKLGLKVNMNVTEDSIPKLTPLFLTSSRTGIIDDIVSNIRQISVEMDNKLVLVGENDTFLFSPSSAIMSLPPAPEVEPDELSKVPKNVLLYQKDIPDIHRTPYFDHALYYRSLRTDSFGSSILYSEVLTSTSTILDKNLSLLKYLPTGFTAVATVQIAGRGRGGNIWVSPIGMLAFSTVIRHPLALQSTSSVVFIQYIASLAIVEASRSYGPGYDDLDIRLKWPNDVYARNPLYNSAENQQEYIKLAGVLVNINIYENEYLIVVGCGINTANESPTTSLNALVDHANILRRKRSMPVLEPYKVEKLFALIMSRFEAMYTVFKYRGFEAFKDLYYSRWLHTDKEVILDMYGGEKARIRGITMDYGMLEVEQLDFEGNYTGKKYTLQPDGNSFDIFRGLLRKKE